ncbi:hypothetical protein TNCV_3448891 [Trichonephila clavipes]|nr:hypothetical protein TNCV_3448891 [Trichonephila clavipes]
MRTTSELAPTLLTSTPHQREDVWASRDLLRISSSTRWMLRILIKRFEKAVPFSTRLQLFSSCIQGSSESVQEFAARINKLGTQIFQSGNSDQNTAVRNANDQLLQSRFKSGLRNDIRRFVLARDPLNLDESISAALIEEQNMKLTQIANDERSGLSPSQTENSVISALTNILEEINLRVGRLQDGFLKWPSRSFGLDTPDLCDSISRRVRGLTAPYGGYTRYFSASFLCFIDLKI